MMGCDFPFSLRGRGGGGGESDALIHTGTEKDYGVRYMRQSWGCDVWGKTLGRDFACSEKDELRLTRSGGGAIASRFVLVGGLFFCLFPTLVGGLFPTVGGLSLPPQLALQTPGRLQEIFGKCGECGGEPIEGLGWGGGGGGGGIRNPV